MNVQRLSVRHETVYRYRAPVRFARHEALFRPRDSHDLRLVDAKLTIAPRGAVRWRHDVFGNSIALIDFHSEADQLQFISEITIDHFGQLPLEIDLDPYAARLPFTYASSDLPDLGRTIERHYPDPDREIDAWARRFLEAGDDTMEVFAAMTRAVAADFRYQRREEIGVRPPVETLRTRAGACRDFALLMMEAARSLGVAARFVTGYVYDPAVDGAAPGVQGAGATHAWTQLYLPGAGWIEYDPTNGIVGNANLIRVGVARDPSQAIPLKGTYFGAKQDFIAMTAKVTVRAEPADPPTIKALAS